MPASRRIAIRLAGAAAALVAVMAGAAIAGGLPAPPVLPLPPGGSHDTDDSPANDKVRFDSTGNHSELVESIAITRSPKAAQTVAMSIPPEKLPALQAGDELRVNAEIQPSTTCVERGSRCIGKRYRINPFIRARLVLADAADPAASSIELAPGEVVRCTQRRPNRNHHCPLVFRSANLDISNLGALPCPPDACYVNLLLSADHRKAKPGNRIVLGGDRPNGKVAQDKGRISAITVRNGAAAPTTAVDQVIRPPRGLPLHPRKGGSRKRVIHSIQVPQLGPGDILQATATYRAAQPRGKKGSGGKRRRGRHAYNAFIASDLILADSPTSTTPTKAARTSGLRGELAEGNGFNCTQRSSGFKRPCFVEKAGAVKINNNQQGEVVVYLNLVARSKPLLKNARRKDKVRLRLEGGLRAVRFAPE
jgi:hypothetical protein